MKSKFIVVNKLGKCLNPKEVFKSDNISSNFKEFLKREAFGIPAKDKNKKPKYLQYANKLGFNWEPNADAGFMQYDYKACFILELVKEYARSLVNKIGLPIYEVRGANVFDMSHPVVEAYAKLYGDRLFQFKSGNKHVVMSYDASYPQFNLAGKYSLSYKDLPFAHFSLSDCYRHEQKGECMLLYRHRRFFMPDLHPYFKDVNEAFKWYPKIEKHIMNACREVNRNYQIIAEVASPEAWEKYKDRIIEIAIRRKRNMLVEIHRDKKDRYWIINVDYKIIDKFRQSREIACIQIDVGNAKRLNISYKDKKNNKKYPAIIHSAVPGGIERYLYMIIDNFKESFPIWLHPVQIRLIPVGEKYIDKCRSILGRYSNDPLRIDIDDRSESVSRRVKQANVELIPYHFVVGQNEFDGKGNIKSLEKAVIDIVSASVDKPFRKYSWPELMSKRVI